MTRLRGVPVDGACRLPGGAPTAELRPRQALPRLSDHDRRHHEPERPVGGHRSSSSAGSPASRSFTSRKSVTASEGRRVRHHRAVGLVRRSARFAGRPQRASHARAGCPAPARTASSSPAHRRVRPTTPPLARPADGVPLANIALRVRGVQTSQPVTLPFAGDVVARTPFCALPGDPELRERMVTEVPLIDRDRRRSRTL